MKLIEVAVNVPIRRTFGRSAPPPPPEYDDTGETGGESAEESNLQTFHYHLPPELESVVEAGHLVWVPFRAAEAAGRRAAHVRLFTGADQGRPAAGRVRSRCSRPCRSDWRSGSPPSMLPPWRRRSSCSCLPACWHTPTVRPPCTPSASCAPSLLVHDDAALARLAVLARTTQASKILAWLIAEAEQRGARRRQHGLEGNQAGRGRQPARAARCAGDCGAGDCGRRQLSGCP